jgi:hypothetical protein
MPQKIINYELNYKRHCCLRQQVIVTNFIFKSEDQRVFKIQPVYQAAFQLEILV